MPIRSIVNPSGPYSSTCGYCSPPGERTADRSSRHTASLSALRLSCGVYQKMIDRGWRRSGTFCYKPDMRTTCCPQYTIRLDTTEFKASRSQRKLVNRWNRFVIAGHASEYLNSDSDGNASKRKRTKDSSFSLCDSIHASEKGFIGETTTTLHAFETTIEPSSFTEEKYALFRKYQMNIHNDSSTPSGFERFLVESPLLSTTSHPHIDKEEPITYAPGAPSHLPRSYGSYHQLYRLDGKLVAVGVIDILPHCVSSVYFFYDDTWEEFSLGKLSALREISLVCEMRNASVPGMDFLYMGFYVHSCQKMRYKAQYSPSYLADPETYDWYPISHCLPLLDKYKYASFNRPNNSRSDPSYDGQGILQAYTIKLLMTLGGLIQQK
ncbi:Arginyl-tRNA--protein transferase 1 [Termitomyces sp. J132]|nr:Arginyl-tRNA--protein transferase 1 [Termitomyces sp. J132]